MADSLENVRDRLIKLRRDFGLEHQMQDKENLTGSLTNTMDPTTWLVRIGEAGNKPEDWLDYLHYLEHRGQFPDLTNKYRAMWSAYNRAMKSIQLDLHRRNEAYAQIVVKFAWLKETENVDEARLLFKFARGNIKPFAFVHVAAAQLERKHNDLEKCLSILKKAMDIGAQPRQLLDTALKRCQAGEMLLMAPPQDGNNGNKPSPPEDNISRVANHNIVQMEVDPPGGTLAPKVNTPTESSRTIQTTPPEPSVLDQSKVDSTVSFNPPEQRNRHASQSSSDDADTIPWINNKFNTFNHQAANKNPRVAHTVCKSSRGGTSLVTPDCKMQGMSSASVGGASRRRPRGNIGAATRIKLAAPPQLSQQISNPDDSDDDDSYFVDFKPLGKISPPSGQIGDNKPKSALPAIIESTNSMDSGVGLTPDEVKTEPGFPNVVKTSNQPATQSATNQQTSPVATQPPVHAPVPSQPELITPVEAPPAPTPVAISAPVQSTPAPVLNVNKQVGGTSKPQPSNQDAPFVPPRMPARKSKDTITVNGKHYSILSTIGKGGSSKVFEAFSEDKKVLAIKSVNLEYADDMTIKGYLNEITLLHKLRKSDHIIKLYDYEVTDHHLAIVMERGSVDLSTFLKRNKNINGEKIKFYWLEMLEAVEVVHKQGIIHSDLKPANFLFVEGKLKLIDFGIANAIQADKTSVVRESQVGTLNYMSPEAIQDTSPTPQLDARGHRKPRLKINCKSDVWSLGCILYYMVYGRTPFQKITNTLVKLQAICDPQHEIAFPDIENKLLLDVLKKCLIRNPRDRPSIQELLNHPYLKSSVQPTTEISQDSGSLTVKHVQSLIAQLTQLSSPNTLNTLSRTVMEQVAKGQEINVANVLKPASSSGEYQPPPPPPVPPPVSHAAPPYSSGMYQPQYQQPPVTTGMVPTPYGGSAFHHAQPMGGEPLRPIARAPLQALNMEDLQRAQSSLQPVANSSSAKYMTQQEKENNDLESVLRRQLAHKYQHAQPQHEDSTYEQTWTTQTMK